MIRVKQRGPQGSTYTVRRRWLPWRRKVEMPDSLGGFSGVGDDLGCLGVIAVIVMVPFLVVAVIALVELLLLLLLLPVWLLVRVVLRRPWTIEVRRDRRLVHTEKVVGWQASDLRMRRLLDDAVLSGR